MGLPKLRSIFGAFLVPTWLHFASQNPPKTIPKATPRGTKILIDFCIAFLSFLAPFWPPTWGQLGAQDGFKIEKMRSKNSGVAHPERFEMRPCFSTPSWAVLAPFWPPTWRHFGPSWLRFGPSWMIFSNFLAYFGYVFGCSYAPPDPPAPDLVFVILGQFFSQFAKRIQELAEDKAENKIPTESHKKHQTTKLSTSKLQKMGGGTA